VTQKKNLTLFLLVAVVVVLGMLHWITPGDKIFLHELYRRLNYFPIVVGALLYGIRTGFFLALCTIIAYIPHLHHFYWMGFDFYISELTEIILYLAAGTVTGALASKERNLRKKYQELSEKLERSYTRLHDQAEILIDVEEQLRTSQKLSALGELSASLAHEIKNPLASIRGTAEISLDEFPEGHPKSEFVKILLKETARLNKTVEEVLNFSKRKKIPDDQPPRMESLLDTINSVASLIEGKLYKKGIILVPDIPDTAEDCMVDGDKMAQVLLNLLLNSYEAVGSQGKIWLQVEIREKEIVVVVADNGPGIPETERQKIFAPFYSTREEGTGLGLAISSRIIENFGGTISVDARPGGGANFTIILPRQHGHQPSSLRTIAP